MFGKLNLQDLRNAAKEKRNATRSDPGTSANWPKPSPPASVTGSAHTGRDSLNSSQFRSISQQVSDDEVDRDPAVKQVMSPKIDSIDEMQSSQKAVEKSTLGSEFLRDTSPQKSQKPQKESSFFRF